MRNFTNIWKLNSILLNKQWVKEESTKEILKYFEMNENESATSKNLLHVAKAVPRVIFTAANAYIKKEDRSQVTTLTLFFPALLRYGRCTTLCKFKVCSVMI